MQDALDLKRGISLNPNSRYVSWTMFLQQAPHLMLVARYCGVLVLPTLTFWLLATDNPLLHNGTFQEKYSTVKVDARGKDRIHEGSWVKDPMSQQIVYSKELEQNLMVVPK